MTTITATTRSAVLEPGSKPLPGWTVKPCRDCKGSGSHPDPYLCLHCGGAGYFQINPNPVEPKRHTPSEPTCSRCGGHQVTYTAEAWADVWRCEDCDHTRRYSLGD